MFPGSELCCQKTDATNEKKICKTVKANRGKRMQLQSLHFLISKRAAKLNLWGFFLSNIEMLSTCTSYSSQVASDVFTTLD